MNVNKLLVSNATPEDNSVVGNTYYYGFVWFGSVLMVEDDKDLAAWEKMQEIEKIWKTEDTTDTVLQERNNLRLKIENQAKLDMLSRGKYRYKLI